MKQFLAICAAVIAAMAALLIGAGLLMFSMFLTFGVHGAFAPVFLLVPMWVAGMILLMSKAVDHIEI